jgi:hypothetical protein
MDRRCLGTTFRPRLSPTTPCRPRRGAEPHPAGRGDPASLPGAGTGPGRAGRRQQGADRPGWRRCGPPGRRVGRTQGQPVVWHSPCARRPTPTTVQPSRAFVATPAPPRTLSGSLPSGEGVHAATGAADRASTTTDPRPALHWPNASRTGRGLGLGHCERRIRTRVTAASASGWAGRRTPDGEVDSGSLSGAFPAQHARPGPERLRGDRRRGDPHHLRPTADGHGPRAARRHRRQARRQFPKVGGMLREAASPDILAFAGFATTHWKKI